MGLIFAAFLAGYILDIIPTSIATPKDRIIDDIVTTGSSEIPGPIKLEPDAAPRLFAPIIPNIIPNMPPIRLIINPSIKKIDNTSVFLAPIAFIIPIS